MLQRAPNLSSLHVLIATPSGRGGRGGIDRIMEALAGELSRQGDGNLEVRLGATRGAGSLALAPFYMAGFLLSMLGRRAAGRLDLVHINLSSNGSTRRKIVVAAAARRLGVPYILHLHAGDYREYWAAAGPGLDRAITAMFEGAARIVVLGRLWRDFIAARVPAAAGRIVVLPNASARPGLPHRGGGDSVHILFLGKLIAAKGVPQLGEALRRMADLPGWRATLAGDGGLAEARVFVQAHGLAERVDLPGWVDGARVEALVAGADILVLPSLSENLPLSVIEGMASGLAVVATPVGSVGDIIADGETGLLVPPGDAGLLAEAMTRLVLDPALRARLGGAAQAFHRERLDLDPFARAFAALWRDVVRESADRR